MGKQRLCQVLQTENVHIYCVNGTTTAVLLPVSYTICISLQPVSNYLIRMRSTMDWILLLHLMVD